MNPFLRFTLIASSLLLRVDADDSMSTIRFLNKDQINGRLSSFDTERIVWNSDSLVKPTPFFLNKVLDLTLPAKSGENASNATHKASVILMNGDTVNGQLASVTDEIIELDTWYAGRLKFNRVMVRSLDISQLEDFIFSGPVGMKGWVPAIEPASWKFSNTALISEAPGSIAREFDLPDEFTLSFDLAWRGGLRFNLTIFSDDVTTDNPENGYDIVFQRRSVHLRKAGNHNWLGHTSNAAELQENEKARIKIQASAKTGNVCFYVNDRIIDVWNDPGIDAQKLGKAIHFTTPDNTPTRLSRIELSKWDGVIEKMPDPRVQGNIRIGGFNRMPLIPDTTQADPASKGRMLLRNGDHLKGEVLAIKDGQITLKTEFAEVQIPVERLQNITLKPVDLEEPKKYNGDVRATFADGSSMVFRLEKVVDGRITGFSQNFGNAEFDMNAFTRIEFDIYNPDLEQSAAIDDQW
jgi:hypothetical protein